MTALLPARRRRVKRESLTTMLVQDLRSMITSRALKPGDRLPTEQEVANAFGVSRTVVREAVARLKAEGLVETRQGVGAFVSDGMTARPFRLDSVEDTIQEVLHVLELRMSVEIEGAGLAALRRTAAQLSQLDRSIRNFEIEIDRNESAVDADLDFHRRIAAATNNPQYLRFLEFLGPYLIPRLKVPPIGRA